MSNLFDLKNKAAIITGGNGVLGGAMAKGLADAGAAVFRIKSVRIFLNYRIQDLPEFPREFRGILAGWLFQRPGRVRSAATVLAESR